MSAINREGGGRVASRWRLWLAIGAALVAVVVTDVHRRYRDTLSEYLYFRNHPDETVWAEGFSDAGFRKVHEGMTRRAVIGLLGTPLESKDLMCGCHTDAVQSWTRSRSDGAYRERIIFYSDDYVTAAIGRVANATKE